MVDTMMPPVPSRKPPSLDEQQLEIQRLEAQAKLRAADAAYESAQTEGEKAAAAEARRQAMREWRETAGGMSYEYGLGYGLPLTMAAVGHLAGHLQSNLIDRFQRSRANSLAEVAGPGRDISLSDVVSGNPEARARAAGVVRGADPYMPKSGLRAAPGHLVRMGSYFLPAAALAAEGYALRRNAEPSDDEFYRPAGDIQQSVGTGMIGTGAGLAIEGGRRSMFPTTPEGYSRDVATVRGLDAAMKEQPRQTPPAASRATEAPRMEPTHSDKLKAAVKAAGGPTVRTKAEAQAWLDKNVTDANRGAVGRALGVRPGPNFAQRLTRTIKDMASRPGMALLAPFGAAAVSYDAARSGAEAGDGEISLATGVPEAAIAGGATAGGVYGIDRAIDWGRRHFPRAMRVGGRLAGPLGFGMLGYDAYQTFRDADIDPGQKYPATTDIRRAYRQHMGYE